MIEELDRPTLPVRVVAAQWIVEYDDLVRERRVSVEPGEEEGEGERRLVAARQRVLEGRLGICGALPPPADWVPAHYQSIVDRPEVARHAVRDLGDAEGGAELLKVVIHALVVVGRGSLVRPL